MSLLLSNTPSVGNVRVFEAVTAAVTLLPITVTGYRPGRLEP